MYHALTVVMPDGIKTLLINADRPDAFVRSVKSKIGGSFDGVDVDKLGINSQFTQSESTFLSSLIDAIEESHQ